MKARRRLVYLGKFSFLGPEFQCLVDGLIEDDKRWDGLWRESYHLVKPKAGLKIEAQNDLHTPSTKDHPNSSTA